MHEPSPLPEPVELFRYLRTLVDLTTTSDSSPRFALVEAYWHIGRIIVETEQAGQARADYGIHLIESLSAHLTQALGKGYSLPNMWRFKQFFLAFPIPSTNGRELPDLRQLLRPELLWSHYRILMQLQDLQERAFYLHKAADEQWTVRVLQRLIRTRYYYQVALGDTQLLAPKTQDAGASPVHRIAPTLSAVGGTPRTRLANIKKILLERYVGYAFVAQRQYVSVEGTDRWAELVFFHFVLNRFVLIQLGEHDPFTLEQFRQMVDAYETKQAPTVDKPPVGIVINQEGAIMLVTTSHESLLSSDEEAALPQTLA